MIEWFPKNEQNEDKFPKQSLVDLLNKHADELDHDLIDGNDFYPIFIYLFRQVFRLLPDLGFRANFTYQFGWEHGKDFVNPVNELFIH